MLFIALSELMTIYISIFIWQNSGSKNSDVITYLVFGFLFNLMSKNYVFNWLPEIIYSGKMNSMLMYPTNLFAQIMSRGLGQMLIANLIGLITFPLILIGTWQNLQLNWSVFNIFITLIFVFIAFLIGVFYNIIISTVAFYTFEYAGIIVASNVFLKVFSGFFFPFSIVSSLYLVGFNPIAFTFYQPMQILLDKYSPNQSLFILFFGFFWCVILYLLAKLAIKFGLKRNEAVGL
jgi:ABC-type uncharacterized transport system permease subunit